MASTGGDQLCLYWGCGHFCVSWHSNRSFISEYRRKANGLTLFLNFVAGLIGSVDALTSSSIVGWVKLYNLTFLVGVAISFTVMSVLGLLFPPQGQGLDEPFIGMQGDGESSPPSPMVEDERQVAKMENDQV